MKTNIELAWEAGAEIDRGSELLLCGSAIDRYTALVEARLMAKLLEESEAQPAQEPLTNDEIHQVRHCMIAVRDWMAGNCDTNEIPRPHIAALVSFAAHGIGGKA